MRAKLGLFTHEPEDKALVDDLLALMQRESADFTNTFRSLTSERADGQQAGQRVEPPAGELADAGPPAPNSRRGAAGSTRAAAGSRSRRPRSRR